MDFFFIFTDKRVNDSINLQFVLSFVGMCLVDEKMFAIHFSSHFLWRFFFVVGVVLEGIGHGLADGWFDAHATFYGANQSPSTLGEFRLIMGFFFSFEYNPK